MISHTEWTTQREKKDCRARFSLCVYSFFSCVITVRWVVPAELKRTFLYTIRWLLLLYKRMAQKAQVCCEATIIEDVLRTVKGLVMLFEKNRQRVNAFLMKLTLQWGETSREASSNVKVSEHIYFGWRQIMLRVTITDMQYQCLYSAPQFKNNIVTRLYTHAS